MCRVIPKEGWAFLADESTAGRVGVAGGSSDRELGLAARMGWAWCGRDARTTCSRRRRQRPGQGHPAWKSCW